MTGGELLLQEAKSRNNVVGKEAQGDLVEDENNSDQEGEEGDHYATYEGED